MLYFFAVKRGERCPGLKDYRTRACLQPRWGGRYPKTRSQWRWRTSPASLHCKGRTSLRSQFHSMLSSTRRTLQDFHQQASKHGYVCSWFPNPTCYMHLGLTHGSPHRFAIRHPNSDPIFNWVGLTQATRMGLLGMSLNWNFCKIDGYAGNYV